MNGLEDSTPGHCSDRGGSEDRKKERHGDRHTRRVYSRFGPLRKRSRRPKRVDRSEKAPVGRSSALRPRLRACVDGRVADVGQRFRSPAARSSMVTPSRFTGRPRC